MCMKMQKIDCMVNPHEKTHHISFDNSTSINIGLAPAKSVITSAHWLLCALKVKMLTHCSYSTMQNKKRIELRNPTFIHLPFFCSFNSLASGEA